MDNHTRLDIIDGQVHMHLTMDMAQTLASMDAMGIQAIVVDEFWYYTPDGKHPMPCIQLANGAHRPTAPGAQFAAMRLPDRFAVKLRIDPHDPDLAAVIRLAAQDPSIKALRVEARSPDELRDYTEGVYGPVFAAAAEVGLPVFVLAPRNALLSERYLQEHPGCRIVTDHIGICKSMAEYDELLGLARYPNAYLQWSHPHRTFDGSVYPFPEAIDGLVRAIAAYGEQRIVWASDFTAIRTGHTWADCLHYLRDSPRISAEHKRWILGASLRRLLNWPAPAELARPVQHRH